MKLYIRTSFEGNKGTFKVCNEKTDEVIAIFFEQDLAIEYVKYKEV